MFHFNKFNLNLIKWLYNIRDIYRITGIIQFPVHNNYKTKYNTLERLSKFTYRHKFSEQKIFRKPLVLTTFSFVLAYCNSLINSKQTDKRFFRAVQYGVDQEVKR